jgi:glutathione peroxidase-family protein
VVDAGFAESVLLIVNLYALCGFGEKTTSLCALCGFGRKNFAPAKKKNPSEVTHFFLPDYCKSV